MLRKSISMFYFSGSGNTKKLVDAFTKTLSENAYTVDLKKMENQTSVKINEGSSLGLAFPVAMQSTYPLVWNFVKSLPKVKNVNVFMFDTMESFSGGIVGPMKKVLTKKGYHCLGAKEFKMSSSLNTNPNKIEKGKQKNILAINDVKTFATDLINGQSKWRRIPLLSDLMRSISLPRIIWTKTSQSLEVTQDCIQCQLCVKNCPVSAIKLIEKNIVIDHSTCNVCMRCASLCPKNAIVLNGKKILFST